MAEALSNYSQQYVHMPGADERQRIMDRVYEVSGIPMVFGIVDGSSIVSSLIPLQLSLPSSLFASEGNGSLNGRPIKLPEPLRQGKEAAGCV